MKCFYSLLLNYFGTFLIVTSFIIAIFALKGAAHSFVLFCIMTIKTRDSDDVATCPSHTCPCMFFSFQKAFYSPSKMFRVQRFSHVICVKNTPDPQLVHICVMKDPSREQRTRGRSWI